MFIPSISFCSKYWPFIHKEITNNWKSQRLAKEILTIILSFPKRINKLTNFRVIQYFENISLSKKINHVFTAIVALCGVVRSAFYNSIGVAIIAIVFLNKLLAANSICNLTSILSTSSIFWVESRIRLAMSQYISLTCSLINSRTLYFSSRIMIIFRTKTQNFTGFIQNHAKLFLIRKYVLLWEWNFKQS